MVDIVSFVHGDKWNIYGWDASVGIRVSDQKTVARIVSLMEFMTGSVFGVANCFCAGHLLRRVFMHSDTNKKKKCTGAATQCNCSPCILYYAGGNKTWFSGSYNTPRAELCLHRRCFMVGFEGKGRVTENAHLMWNTAVHFRARKRECGRGQQNSETYSSAGTVFSVVLHDIMRSRYKGTANKHSRSGNTTYL